MTNFNKQLGASTLEMLLSMALLILCLSAVIMVALTNQAVGVDIQTNSEAISMAQRQLEQARNKASINFNSVGSAASSEDVYQKQLSVEDISACLKKVVSRLDWNIESRPQHVELQTMLSSPAELAALGGDCAVSEPDDAWHNPYTLETVDLIPAGNQGTDIDVVSYPSTGRRIAFVTSKHGEPASADFWAIDVTDPLHPVRVGSLDTGPGLNSIDVAGDYAYVAQNNASNQFQVINVSDPANPVLVSQRSLPGVGNSYPQGRSVFYYNGRVYVGTNETAGNELHIFDVSNPAAPAWLGSREINHNVTRIVVRGAYAYIATSNDNGELMIYDVFDPSSISLRSMYNAPGTGDATAIEVLGTRVYLGRERTVPYSDFFIIDTTDTGAPALAGSKDFDDSSCSDGGGPASCLGPNSAITGIRVSGKLAFLSTSYSTRGFQVWNVSNPGDIQSWSGYNYSEKASNLDFEGNLVYSVNESNAALRIIYDRP